MVNDVAVVGRDDDQRVVEVDARHRRRHRVGQSPRFRSGHSPRCPRGGRGRCARPRPPEGSPLPSSRRSMAFSVIATRPGSVAEGSRAAARRPCASRRTGPAAAPAPPPASPCPRRSCRRDTPPARRRRGCAPSSRLPPSSAGRKVPSPAAHGHLDAVAGAGAELRVQAIAVLHKLRGDVPQPAAMAAAGISLSSSQSRSGARHRWRRAWRGSAARC
jgi:hypothetical protein